MKRLTRTKYGIQVIHYGAKNDNRLRNYEYAHERTILGILKGDVKERVKFIAEIFGLAA